jgi:4-hydroxybenzoate polyprenyltransferase/phosphoserine phosphatase
MTEAKIVRPLCVDLDGTLMCSDTTLEGVMRAIKRAPWVLIFIPFWLRHGIAYCKMRLASYANIDIRLLPWNNEVVEYVQAVRARGRPVWLVTGTYIGYAEQVAKHWGLFDEVLASDQRLNLTGAKKACLLVERCGERGFDYIGNEYKDRHIWLKAHDALVVDRKEKLQNQLPMIAFSKVFAAPSCSIHTLAHALRLHQWIKNLLIFTPLLSTHHELSGSSLISAVIAFVIFSVTASVTYLLNDLFDLDADRQHSKKSSRAFASGKLGIRSGLLIMAGLTLFAALLTLSLPPIFALALLAYMGCNLAYSFKLKQLAGLDIIILASLYLLRVIGGAWAIDAKLSFWLLAFSLFLFLSLAIIKRMAELIHLEQNNQSAITGSGYTINDRFIMQSLGVASGYNALLVLAFYINSAAILPLYQYPLLLWLLCPAYLYWINRIWLLAGRGLIQVDPVLFAIKDRHSWLVGIFCLLVIGLAV